METTNFGSIPTATHRDGNEPKITSSLLPNQKNHIIHRGDTLRLRHPRKENKPPSLGETPHTQNPSLTYRHTPSGLPDAQRSTRQRSTETLRHSVALIRSRPRVCRQWAGRGVLSFRVPRFQDVEERGVSCRRARDDEVDVFVQRNGMGAWMMRRLPRSSRRGGACCCCPCEGGDCEENESRVCEDWKWCVYTMG